MSDFFNFMVEVNTSGPASVKKTVFGASKGILPIITIAATFMPFMADKFYGTAKNLW